MNRRHFLPALTAALAFPAMAMGPERAPRAFPPTARRGRMTPGYAPDIAIDGKPRQLSPAARIFNEENLTVVPGSLRGKDIIVNYTEDIGGNIDRVWILSREEARLRASDAR